ncbi:hypothetical protein CXB51_000515 [Gossypium anomalum]|uniref:Aminotransferase-like plant mobile domain-containing protein n=1 Tax=Gossypium anomalum TaxID=47600 RepID=A0A8J5ZIJ5_9ROSI|nr:hypothetical protein CXB51_000515 [Gossypium anomalum]
MTDFYKMRLGGRVLGGKARKSLPWRSAFLHHISKMHLRGSVLLTWLKLQLGLPVDEAVLTESVQSADWGAICYDLLGAISDNIYRDQLANLVGGLSYWQHCIERCVRRRHQIKPKLKLLLNQQSKAQFQWRTYEDPVIRVVIPKEFFQNLNIWHVNVPLVNYPIVEMHQTDRVLRQFRFRQPIPEELEKNRYDYIPNRKPIIVPELACILDYMPWFRIHGKPYLLSEEQRHRQSRIERERRSPLNLRRRDDGTGQSTVPTQSPSPMPQLMTHTLQPLQIMPGAYPSPYMYPNPHMFPFPSSMPG